jgi:NAD dependent epimerase/dehydratase family enzyme
MKTVLPGGSGHIGRLLTGALVAAGHEVVILTRSVPAGPTAGDAARDGRAPEAETPGAPAGRYVDGAELPALNAEPRYVEWDGRTAGPWVSEIDGADAVINLAGRSVDCRYTAANLAEMMDSRIESTRVVGQAISQAARPPHVWLQMSTATIYAHTFGEPNDELTGEIGGHEPGVPAYWRRSIQIATAWEAVLREAATPSTRKVALRTAMVMSAVPGGALEMLVKLARLGLGGAIAGGRQYVSWIRA